MTLTVNKDGWADGARRMSSPNRSPRPPAAAVSLAVVHGISLPPGEFGGGDIVRLFLNELDCAAHAAYASLCGLCVSAHFLIHRDGELLQFVSCQDAAWHAGDSVWRGRAECNDFSVGIEMEGADDIPYAPRQYDKLTALLGALARRYPNIAVVGHADIAPGRKTDPGAAFDWRRLFAAVGPEHNGRDAA